MSVWMDDAWTVGRPDGWQGTNFSDLQTVQNLLVNTFE
jgi:hypothetical protein